MTEIYIIDTETTTTRFDPEPDGEIVEIGIAQVDTDRMRVTPFFNAVLFARASGEEWVFKNTDLTKEMVENGLDADKVDEMLSAVLYDKRVTAYNLPFDDLMLSRSLPQTHEAIFPVDDLKEIACDDTLTGRMEGIGPNGPSLLQSYTALCPDDPARIKGAQDHRALSDAIVAGHVCLALLSRGHRLMEFREASL